MKRGVGLAVLVSGAVIVTTVGAQVYPPRWHEDQPEPESAGSEPLPALVLADGDLEFPDGTFQLTAPGSGESLAATPSPSLVLADGGIQFSDGTVQTTAAGSLVPRTGLAICYTSGGFQIDCSTDIGPGQDGALQLGAPWPNPRFTINESSPGVADGTVSDNLTGLIWLKDASCAALAGTDTSGLGTWATGLSAANTLAEPACGLSDGSVAGDWRLPNRFELESLLDLRYYSPALSNVAGTAQWDHGDAFDGVEPAYYWTSTTEPLSTHYAWYVYFYLGHVGNSYKGSDLFIWPVRGGQ